MGSDSLPESKVDIRGNAICGTSMLHDGLRLLLRINVVQLTIVSCGFCLPQYVPTGLSL